jgi:putative peptide zinc metalloprotease protein
MAAPAQRPALADRLKGVVVSMRGELDISRHVFRAGPAYVLRDPVTFQTHRFDPEDYRILNAIERNTTLGETFDKLVAQGVLDISEEEDFYGFILELHQRNLLSLPVSDGDTLFKRFERRKQAERLSKLLGIFFLRVPLINPDRFLTRTSALFSWLFTLPAFFAWLALAGFAGFIAVARWDDLSAPVLTVFDGGNLFMLWGTLIGLKVIHEFGHAYACKAYGGHVPEMGAFFVLFTPLAYVDASDSWSFTKMRRRAVVTLAGVYVESIIGAIALIVWALTEPGTLNTLCYQIVLLATITTALFNLNPLLRYDAYYLVSDLSGVPNLRARCQHAVASLFKRVLYGLKTDEQGEPLSHHPGLVTFGLAQLAYRVVIMLTITTVLIMKFGGAGLVMAGVLIAMMLGKAGASLFQYLASAEELIGRRFRALTVTVGGSLILLLTAALVPIPWPLDARGVATFQNVRTLHAPQDGVIAEMHADVGDTFNEGQTMARLENRALSSQRATLLAEVTRGEAETLRAAFESRAEGMQAHAGERRTRASLEQTERELRELAIDAHRSVRVIEVFEQRRGVRVKQGDPLIRVASGHPEAVFLFRTFEYEALKAVVGDTIALRSPASPDREIQGTITHISPTGSRRFQARHADIAKILSIPVDPNSGDAAEPYFEVRLRLDPSDASLVNSTLRARFPSEKMTTFRVIERRFTRFMNRVKEGFSAR